MRKNQKAKVRNREGNISGSEEAEAPSLVKLSGGNRRKLGQSYLFTHIALVAFGIIFIITIVTTFNTIQSDYREFVIAKELQQVCFVVKGGIENIYHQSSYRSPTSEVQGAVRLNIPAHIGGEGFGYTMHFPNSTLLIEVGRRSYQCKIGFPMNYSGSASGGLMELKFIKNATSDRVEIANV